MTIRALVLSGGGAYGAFQVGVLRKLTELGHSWDLIAGVSVGAINATQMAMYPKDAHASAAKELEAFWNRIAGNKSIYKRWFPFGKLHAFWTGGAYNTAPLRHLLETTFVAEKLASSGVKLCIGAVALGSSDYRYVTETETEIVDWLMASSAQPGLFPPIPLAGDMWVDGGCRDVTPIKDVLAEKPDEIDVVLTMPLDEDPPKQDPKKFKNVVNVGIRSVMILADEVFKSDLNAVPEEDRKKIHVYAPKKHLPYEAFDFAPANLKMAMHLGYEETLPCL